jgi:hypothetical protein
VNPEAHFIRAEKTVSIRRHVPLPVQADGDIIGTTPIDVAVLPGVRTVLVSETPAIVPEEDLPRKSGTPESVTHSPLGLHAGL